MSVSWTTALIRPFYQCSAQSLWFTYDISKFILGDTYLDTWSASKQLRLLDGRVGDSTTVVNSLSPQMSELVEDAIAP